MAEYRKCGAHSRRTGEPCKGRAMANGKCRMHGGKSTGQPIKHGRYSRLTLPTRLAARVEAALGDPDLLSMRSHFAVLEALLGEKLSEFDEAGSAELWGQAAKALGELTSHVGEGGNEPLAALQEVIRRGCRGAEAEKGVREIIHEMTHVARTETARQKEVANFITPAQLNVILSLLADSVNRHVSDPDSRAAISQDIIRILGPTPGGDDRAGGGDVA